jgi:hypothetical protein
MQLCNPFKKTKNIPVETEPYASSVESNKDYNQIKVGDKILSFYPMSTIKEKLDFMSEIIERHEKKIQLLERQLKNKVTKERKKKST